MPKTDFLLIYGYVLRKATTQDIWSIRSLVFKAKLDPTQLNWQQFWVIESKGNIMACGQLRQFPDAQELGSLVVVKPLRKQGLGSFMTQHLISTATQPLYLECLGQELAKFYNRFGFVQIDFTDLPPGLKRKFAFSELVRKLLRIPVVFMHWSR